MSWHKTTDRVDCTKQIPVAGAFVPKYQTPDRSAMSAPQEPKFNDDLLLTDEDRKQVACSFPTMIHVLDFPMLRDLFSGYDALANRSKKRLRRAGLATIALGVVALLGASTEPLVEQFQPGVSSAFLRTLIILPPVAGLLSIVFSTFGVFNSATKNRWLEARLMTERLRQFQFQTLVFRLPTILGCVANSEVQDKFYQARDRWFSSFKIEYVDRLPAKLDEVLDDDIEEQFALHRNDAVEAVDGNQPILDELFSAYRLLRIKHQIQYANYKLADDSYSLPRKQVSLLSGISLACILLIFVAHFAVSIAFLGELVPFASEANGLVLAHSDSIHVLIIWIVIAALAARTFEEGLQPTREVERYTAYKARLGRLLYHFDEASNLAERLRIMTEVERVVYQEMRGFLKTNHEARFVL
jgi:hypothetical protein